MARIIKIMAENQEQTLQEQHTGSIKRIGSVERKYLQSPRKANEERQKI